MFHNHEVDKSKKNVVIFHVIIPTKLKKSDSWKLQWLSVHAKALDFAISYGTPIFPVLGGLRMPMKLGISTPTYVGI